MGLLKLKEAATVLRCSTPTVRRLVNDGELQGVRVGKQLRIDVDEIKRFIGSCGSTPSRIVSENGHAA
jgi:excisionase family DNA binding protein